GREAPPGEEAYAPIPVETDPVRHVEEQMERLLQALEGSAGRAWTAAWAPPLTVWEGEREVVICMDLPGVQRDQVEVQMQGNLLMVRGQRAAAPPDGLRPRFSERPLGAFQRSVPIPGASRSGERSAQLKDGVLEIRVPREIVQQPPARNITIA